MDKQYLQPYAVTMSKHNFTALELRIMVSLLYSLKNFQFKNNITEIDNIEVVKIRKTELIKSGNYQVIKEALDYLDKKRMWIKVGDDGEIKCGLFSNVEIRKYSTDYITFTMDKYTLPKLLELGNNYTRAGVDFTFKTANRYAIRWYQLGCHWLKKGKFQITPMDIRDIFQINEGEYVKSSLFNSKIIKLPIAEVNEKSDLEMSATPKRVNKKIVRWTIEVNKTDSERFGIEETSKQGELFEKEGNDEIYYNTRLHLFMEESKIEREAWERTFVFLSPNIDYKTSERALIKSCNVNEIKNIESFKRRLSKYFLTCLKNEGINNVESLNQYSAELEKY